MENELVFRPLKEEDYETICKWWKWWRWEPINRESLPNNGVGGFMIHDKNTDICAGFVYTTNSNICIVEWIVSNYEIKDKKIRKKAIEMLICTLTDFGKNLGFKVAFTYLLNKNLEETFENCDFVHSSKPIEMIKKL